MKYKVGDKVRVRQWDDMAKEFEVNEFGNINTKTGCFTRQMKKFCGDVYEVNSVLEASYWLKDRNGHIYYWYFTDNMLEDVVLQPAETSSVFFESDKLIFGSDNLKLEFEFKNNKMLASLTSKTPKKQKESEKKMKKQMTQRERLEGQLKEYQRDSGIKSIEIVVPDKVVKVTMDNCTNSTYTMKCHEDDTFSLERAIILAYVKHESEDLTPKGIEYEEEIFTHFKDNMKKLKKAMKLYETQQKLKALDEEEERIRANKKRKKIAQKKRRAERLAEEKLKETKEAAKIYAEELKSVLAGYNIPVETTDKIVKDMNTRV